MKIAGRTRLIVFDTQDLTLGRASRHAGKAEDATHHLGTAAALFRSLTRGRLVAPSLRPPPRPSPIFRR